MSTNGKAVLQYLKSKGYHVSALNLVGIEGLSNDGILNSDEPNKYNDTVMVLTDRGQVLLEANATTEPGYYYTDNPLNPDGCARLKFGQYRDCYELGFHNWNPNHPALIQVGEVTVCRDKNRDMMRTNDKEFTGYFGINIHGNRGDYNPNDISFWSAGCQVLGSWQNHLKMLQLMRDSKPSGSLFTYTLIAGTDLAEFAKSVREPLTV